MSDSEPPVAGDDDAEDSPQGEVELDDVDVKELLRAALGDVDSDKPSPKVLEGVRRTLRDASDGRFFADGWSRSPDPKGTYLVTSLLMLLVIVLAWLLLAPYGVSSP